MHELQFLHLPPQSKQPPKVTLTKTQHTNTNTKKKIQSYSNKISQTTDNSTSKTPLLSQTLPLPGAIATKLRLQQHKIFAQRYKKKHFHHSQQNKTTTASQ